MIIFHPRVTLMHRLFFNEVVTEEKFKAKPILTKT